MIALGGISGNMQGICSLADDKNEALRDFEILSFIAREPVKIARYSKAYDEEVRIAVVQQLRDALRKYYECAFPGSPYRIAITVDADAKIIHASVTYIAIIEETVNRILTDAPLALRQRQ